jgi:deoxyribodipyrimidine photo-lyase
VRRRLAAAGVELRLVDSPYAVDPGRVTKDDGNPYAVFTPFSRAWEKAGWERPIPAPGSVTWRRAASDPIGPEPADSAVLPAPGEAAAHALADEFLETGIGDYADDRNRPDFPGTSRLSPYLRWGVLHPRQLLDRLGEGRGDRVFRSELAWREFYADVLWRRPETAWTSLQPKMRAMPVDDDLAARARFDRWAAGTTGYPIVDAGMRQLAATGWMHNRVRMVVASFLVKDLHLPWQWGAKFFMQRLVDGDLASNSHGWQWTAGTGTDAAPFFRVFNPVSQAEKFDPEGAYVRQWVPELRLVGDADVFAPWRAKGGLPLGALEPMVDHGAERVEALRRYAQVSGQ